MCSIADSSVSYEQYVLGICCFANGLTFDSIQIAAEDEEDDDGVVLLQPHNGNTSLPMNCETRAMLNVICGNYSYFISTTEQCFQAKNTSHIVA